MARIRYYITSQKTIDLSDFPYTPVQKYGASLYKRKFWNSAFLANIEVQNEVLESVYMMYSNSK